MDVDKWDYFARDCHMTGIRSNFDYARAIKFSKVLPDENGIKHICFRDKENDCLFDMFNVRYLIHKRVCYHRATTAVQVMIADALIEAINKQSAEVKFKGQNGDLCDLKEATLDMTAYSKITDDIILQIYRSEDDQLQTARDIVDRVFRRKLYHFVGSKTFDGQFFRVQGYDNRTIHEMAKESFLKLGAETECDNRTKEAIAIYVAKFDYGKDGQDPIDNVYFFTKKNPEIADKLKNIKEIHVSHSRPRRFSEQQVLVYCRSVDKEMQEEVQKMFEKWCEKSN